MTKPEFKGQITGVNSDKNKTTRDYETSTPVVVEEEIEKRQFTNKQQGGEKQFVGLNQNEDVKRLK
jgi:hypothetical protein